MRADKARNRAAVLAAAGRLFDEAADPEEVSMDAIAAAAGVGKGTLFRGFGDRRGLVRAVYDERAAREYAAPSSGSTPAEAALDLLTRTWRFKERNRVLTLTLEREGAAGGPYQNDNYGRIHAELTGIVAAARGPRNADFLAHAMLAAVRSDLVEHLRDHPETDPLAGLSDFVHSLLDHSLLDHSLLDHGQELGASERK